RNRLERRGAFRHRLQHARDAFTKSADLRFDFHTTPLLLRHCRTLSLGVYALGDVIMRADPVLTILDRPIDDQNSTAVGRFDDSIHRLAVPHRSQDLITVLLRINIEAAGRYSIPDQVLQRASEIE